ncbi:RNA polymerase sigma factor [Pedobacter sp. WC2423]|uniref:RNA polymerase sigma factor n=1 Tax=Pedobacter sp. WC2423 TaxID=3234142 RepID=UPI0034650EA0
MSNSFKISDNELFYRLKAGDKVAYAEIYHRYKEFLFVFAYKKTNSEEEAKDLIHELFLTLWEKRTEIVITKELSAYLFWTLRNKIFDSFRHKTVTQKYIDSFSNYLIEHEADTDYLVRHNDLSKFIESEISALPAKMRQAFELSRKSNLTRKQIAAKLNLSEETVKSHIRRALLILKTKLGVVTFLYMFMKL